MRSKLHSHRPRRTFIPLRTDFPRRPVKIPDRASYRLATHLRKSYGWNELWFRTRISLPSQSPPSTYPQTWSCRALFREISLPSSVPRTHRHSGTSLCLEISEERDFLTNPILEPIFHLSEEISVLLAEPVGVVLRCDLLSRKILIEANVILNFIDHCPSWMRNNLAVMACEHFPNF